MVEVSPKQYNICIPKTPPRQTRRGSWLNVLSSDVGDHYQTLCVVACVRGSTLDAVGSRLGSWPVETEAR